MVKDLVRQPETDPTQIYRYRDGLYAQDLLIVRTGGELRLSNFLLWQAAYAELVFLPVFWPDFDASHLNAAIEEFGSRVRRYGGHAARSLA